MSNKNKTVAPSSLPTIVGELDADQIAKLKEEHGVKKLNTIKVQVNENEQAIAYLKPVDRFIKGKMLKVMPTEGVLKAGLFYLQNSFVGGDPRIQTDETIADSAALACNDLIDIYETETGEV